MFAFPFPFTVLTFTLLVVLSQVPVSIPQLLFSEYLNAKLPFPNKCPKPFYNGGDKVYLLGGCELETETQILVYTLTSDTIEVVGTLPGKSIQGTVQADPYGNIFYLGGGSNYRQVYKFDTTTNTTTTVAELPSPVRDSISFKLNNILYIMGGYGQGTDLLAFDLQLFNYSIVTSLMYETTGGAFAQSGDKANIFARAGQGAALELDLNTWEMTSVGPHSLPWFDFYPSSVRHGNLAYVIGGYRQIDAPTGGIIQFNMDTFENTFLPVRNFPVEGRSIFHNSPASVLIPSSNRIYCFGGYSFNATLNDWIVHDEIFYIDLTHLDFFSCSNRTSGFYPNPMDCSMYIGCEDKEMTFFQCPTPLLFDPVLTTCNPPDQVQCGLSCEGHPDGNYPHPHDDCSLYITCESGVPSFFKCPPPLLFHPVQRNCEEPELVTCSIRS